MKDFRTFSQTSSSLMSWKFKYLASVAPFVVMFLVMAAWMLSDLVELERSESVYTYRGKHNFGWLMLPFVGFCFVSGFFVARLGRLAIIPALFFFGMGLFSAWTGMTLDTSNHHVRVSRDRVYSEWGTKQDPVSATLNYRDLESLTLLTESDGETDRKWIVGRQADGEVVRMPVNDLVQVALKRIFAYATAHGIELRFE